MKSKRSKACDISAAVKAIVWERDNQMCVKCKSIVASPNAHYIPRSHGGLGIEQNILTLCAKCHYEYDHTLERKKLMVFFGMYLDAHYPNFKHEDRFFKKGKAR